MAEMTESRERKPALLVATANVVVTIRVVAFESWRNQAPPEEALAGEAKQIAATSAARTHFSRSPVDRATPVTRFPAQLIRESAALSLLRGDGSLAFAGASVSDLCSPSDMDLLRGVEEPRRKKRKATTRRSAISILMGADALAAGIALVLAQVLERGRLGEHGSAAVLASALYIPVFVLLIGAYGLYHRPQRRLVSSSFPDIGRFLHGLVLASFVVLVASGPLHRWFGFPAVDQTAAVLAGALALLVVPVTRTATRLAVSPESATSNVLIVGSGQVAGMVAARLGKVGGMCVVGRVDDDPDADDRSGPQAPRLGRMSDLEQLIERWDIDHVIVAFSFANEAEMAAHLRSVPGHVRISVVPRMFDLLTVRSNVDDLRGLPVVDVAPASLGLAERTLKRTMDIVVSASALLVLAPVLAVVAVLVKLTSEGPVFFAQNRAGRNGHPFRILKFRTMYQGSEQLKAALSNDVDGPLFKAHHDPRVTPVGRVLRKLSLDELPQLLNVLAGQMSLVGPRPFVISESSQIDGWAARRFDVRPGLTGLWQISGRNDLPFEELCRLDYLYVASWSLWWDLAILWRTPGRVLRQDGAY